MKTQTAIVVLAICIGIFGVAYGQGWLHVATPDTDTEKQPVDLASAPPETGTVKRVIDPITIQLTSGHIVRYIGVRTPAVDAKVECFGKEALLANESVVGRTVRLEEEPLLERSSDGAWTRYVFLEPDESSPGVQASVAPSPESTAASEDIAPDLGDITDTAKQVLGSSPTPSMQASASPPTEQAEPEEIFINERILEGGFGFPVVSQNMKYGQRMLSAAKFASATGKGLWGRCEVSSDNDVFNTQTLDACTIKGKVSANGEKLYRTQECQGYEQTVVIQNDGGQWFCAPDLAEDAGFIKAPDCP